MRISTTPSNTFALYIQPFLKLFIYEIQKGMKKNFTKLSPDQKTAKNIQEN